MTRRRRRTLFGLRPFDVFWMFALLAVLAVALDSSWAGYLVAAAVVSGVVAAVL